jgi:bifunctional DNA-binding transcriptional regulator/antitoxin component of YhaV-PrlF toxin-antitoxin module
LDKGEDMLTVKSNKKDLITFPENLLSKLGIKEGEKIEVKVKKGSLVIIKEAKEFFALEGALKDVDIETPIKELRKSWKKWKPKSL